MSWDIVPFIVYLRNKAYFSMGYRHNKPHGMLEEHKKSCKFKADLGKANHGYYEKKSSFSFSVLDHWLTFRFNFKRDLSTDNNKRDSLECKAKFLNFCIQQLSPLFSVIPIPVFLASIPSAFFSGSRCQNDCSRKYLIIRGRTKPI